MDSTSKVTKEKQKKQKINRQKKEIQSFAVYSLNHNCVQATI